MKKLLIIVLIISSGSLFAQKTIIIDEDNKPAFKDRIFFGGGVGFGIGNDVTSIQLNPIVGYMITSKWSAGVGVEYNYVKYKYFDISDNIWGGQLFTRYNIRQFFLQAEYDLLNYTEFYTDGSQERATIGRFLLGGGISQPIGRSGSINLLAMYDLNYLDSGPYGSPWVFRIYFSM